MDVEKVNAVLSKAITRLQDDEIEGISESFLAEGLDEKLGKLKKGAKLTINSKAYTVKEPLDSKEKVAMLGLRGGKGAVFMLFLKRSTSGKLKLYSYSSMKSRFVEPDDIKV